MLSEGTPTARMFDTTWQNYSEGSVVSPADFSACHRNPCIRVMVGYFVSEPYGVIDAVGADTSDLLQRLTSNDVSAVPPGSGLRSVLLTEKGRIVDVLTLLHRQDRWQIVTSPGCQENVYRWIRRFIIMDDVRLVLRDGLGASIELWSAEQTNIAELFPSLAEREGSWVDAEIGGVQVTALRLWNSAACPTTRGQMILLLCPATHRDAVITWLGAHRAQQLLPDERNRLRIEFRIGQYPNEYSEQYTPLEAGLAHIVALGKGCFIGQEVLERLAVQQKLRWRLHAIEAPSGTLREGETLRTATPESTTSQSDIAGVVTSVAANARASALAYIRRDAGSQLQSEHGVAIRILEPIGTTVS